MAGFFGGGGDTKTTTQTTVLPDWASGQQQNLINTGNGMLTNFLRNPSFSVAGTNPDQETAFDFGRHTLINTFDTPGLNASGAGNVNAAQINPGAINQFMNPFLQGVVDPTVNSMRRDYQTSAADAAARAAASNAFGGSRGAVERSNLDRNFADKSAQMVAQLMAQGYSQAQAMAQANAQMQQQANIANGVNGLQAQQLNNSFLNDRQAREIKAVQQLLGIGNQQQQLTQSAVDAPFTALQRMLGITPSLNNVGGTVTKTEPDDSPGMGQQLLGLAASVAGKVLPAMLSDRNEKTNLQKLLTDPATGLDIYAYDYKADVEAAKKNGTPMGPKRVGPMAQDVEKVAPGSTQHMGGKLVMKGR